ncbi:hypothetical protein BJ878DRAFT_530088 [Calycina marina]|uniref:Uncharacterized protein n=1 Tax=Calycina marina TaxID=1763456 RepID=A0A9P7YTU0_9HELO|nr:hypothetical protein BJ878DRAFT_530088 [Calycina marina]
MFFFNKETIFEETSEISAGHYKAVEAWEAHGGNAAAAAAEGLNLVENDAVAGKGIVYMERICFRARALLEAMHQLKPCKLTCFGKMEPGFTEAFELLIGDVKTFGRALRAGRNTEHYVLKGIDVAGEVSMARKTYGTVLEALLELADGREARIGLTAFASKPEAKHKHVVRTVLGLLPQLQEALQTVLVPMERIKVMEGWPPAWCTVVAGGTSEAWHINSRFNGCLIAWTGRSSEKKAKKYMTRS